MVAMVKAMKTIRYTYEGKRYTPKELYAHMKKRPGTAHVLAVASIQLKAQGGIQPVQPRVRPRPRLRFPEVARPDHHGHHAVGRRGHPPVCGKLRDIEVFFKSAKSALNLVHEFYG